MKSEKPRSQHKELTPSGVFYRDRDMWIRYVIRRPKDQFTHVEKLVAVYIAETLNPSETAWVTSQARIANEMGIGVRVVKSAVAKLKKEGLIVATRVRVDGHIRLFNAYRLVKIEDAEPS